VTALFQVQAIFRFLRRAGADRHSLSAFDDRGHTGAAGCRVARAVLAATHWARRPPIHAAKVPHLATAIRLARPAGTGAARTVIHRATAAPDAPRRTATIAERAGRRHGLDRSTSAPAGGSADESCDPPYGSPRHYRLGAGQWRQVSDTAGKGPVRRILHP